MRLVPTLKKIFSLLRVYGVFTTVFVIGERLLLRMARRVPYYYWIRYLERRENDRERPALICKSLRYKPKFTILVIDTSGDNTVLSVCLKSILDQVYDNWEVHVLTKSNGSVEASITGLKSRFKLQFLSGESISRRLKKALASAIGQFTLVCGSEWSLSRYCLLECALELNVNPALDVIYSDQDSITVKGIRFNPIFSPQWCPDSYFSGVFPIFPGMCRTSVLREVLELGRLRQSCLEWELGLRITEITEKIRRIPIVLFHRQIIRAVQGRDSSGKIENSGIVALEESLRRRGSNPYVKLVDRCSGKYLVRYRLTQKPGVSVIIPTRDRSVELSVCLNSVFSRSTYKDFEVIVVDNRSCADETSRVFRDFSKKYPDIFRCVAYDDQFNFSRINNFAVTQSKNSYLVFLNNDTEVLTIDWIEAMVEYAQRRCTGAVGAKLLYPTGLVQHAGIIVGPGGAAVHAFRRFQDGDGGYCGRLQTVNNYSAVTGACLMCRRDVFEEAGGFDEKFEVSFGDVDLCLKFLELGYYNVCLPHVKLYHHESLTRGTDDTEQKACRTRREMAYLASRWQKYIDDDPCYNPNLTRKHSNFSINIDRAWLNPDVVSEGRFR